MKQHNVIYTKVDLYKIFPKSTKEGILPEASQEGDALSGLWQKPGIYQMGKGSKGIPSKGAKLYEERETWNGTWLMRSNEEFGTAGAQMKEERGRWGHKDIGRDQGVGDFIALLKCLDFIQ